MQSIEMLLVNAAKIAPLQPSRDFDMLSAVDMHKALEGGPCLEHDACF